MADSKKSPEEEWAATGPVVDPSYNPREDPGPERIEDKAKPTSPYVENYKPIKSSDKDVPLEDSVKDDTTVLATEGVPEAALSPEE